MVAGRERGDVGAGPLDYARALVAEHGRGVAGGVGAGGRVEVRVADAAGREPDQDLAGARLGELDLLDRERLPEALQNGRAHLHGCSSSSARAASSESFTSSASASLRTLPHAGLLR